VGPSTGLSDVGGQRLVTKPIRGRADELKVIGALVAAVAQGRGGVLVIEGPQSRCGGLLAEICFVPLVHTTLAYLVEFLVKRSLLIFDGATDISHSVVDGIV
jgi:hypothetical protein